MSCWRRSWDLRKKSWPWLNCLRKKIDLNWKKSVKPSSLWKVCACDVFSFCTLIVLRVKNITVSLEVHYHETEWWFLYKMFLFFATTRFTQCPRQITLDYDTLADIRVVSVVSIHVCQLCSKCQSLIYPFLEEIDRLTSSYKAAQTEISNLEQEKREHETERRKLHNTIQELKVH